MTHPGDKIAAKEQQSRAQSILSQHETGTTCDAAAAPCRTRRPTRQAGAATRSFHHDVTKHTRSRSSPSFCCPYKTTIPAKKSRRQSVRYRPDTTRVEKQIGYTLQPGFLHGRPERERGSGRPPARGSGGKQCRRC